MSAIVQDAFGFVTSNAITINGSSANPLAAGTAGNLWIAGLTNAATPGNPSITGFNTLDTIKANASMKAMLATRIVQAGDSAVAMGSSLTDNLVGHVIEVSGMGAAPVLEAINTPIEVVAGTSWTDDIDVVDPEAIIVTLVGFAGGSPGSGQPAGTSGWISTGAVNRFGCLWYRRPGAAGNYPFTLTWTNNAVTAFGFMAVVAPTPAGGGGGGGGGGGAFTFGIGAGL